MKRRIFPSLNRFFPVVWLPALILVTTAWCGIGSAADAEPAGAVPADAEPAGVASTAETASAARAPDVSGTDVPTLYAFLIDDTASNTVSENGAPPSDPNGVRYQAAQVVLALAGDTDDFLLITFRGMAETVVPLTPIGDKTHRYALQAALNHRPDAGTKTGTSYHAALTALLNQLETLDHPVDLQLIFITDGINFTDIFGQSDPFHPDAAKGKTDPLAVVKKILSMKTQAGNPAGRLAHIGFTAFQLDSKGVGKTVITDLIEMKRLFKGQLIQTADAIGLVDRCIGISAATEGYMRRPVVDTDPRSRIAWPKAGVSRMAVVALSDTPAAALIDNVRLVGAERSVDLSVSGNAYIFPNRYTETPNVQANLSATGDVAVRISYTGQPAARLSETGLPIAGLSPSGVPADVSGGEAARLSQSLGMDHVPPAVNVEIIRFDDPVSDVYDISLSDSNAMGVHPELKEFLFYERRIFHVVADQPPTFVYEKSPFTLAIEAVAPPADIAGMVITTKVEALITETIDGASVQTQTIPLSPETARISRDESKLTFIATLRGGLVVHPGPPPDKVIPPSTEAQVTFRIIRDFGDGVPWVYALPPVTVEVRKVNGLLELNHAVIQPEPDRVVIEDGVEVIEDPDIRSYAIALQVSSTYDSPQRVRMSSHLKPAFLASVAFDSSTDFTLKPGESKEIKAVVTAQYPGEISLEFMANRIVLEDEVEKIVRQEDGSNRKEYRITFPAQNLALKRKDPTGDAIYSDYDSKEMTFEIVSSFYTQPISVNIWLSPTHGALSSTSGSLSQTGTQAAWFNEYSFSPASPIRIEPGQTQEITLSLVSDTDGRIPFVIHASCVTEQTVALSDTEVKTVKKTTLAPPLTYSITYRKQDLYLNTKLFKLDMGRYPLDATPMDAVLLEVPGAEPFVPGVDFETLVDGLDASGLDALIHAVETDDFSAYGDLGATVELNSADNRQLTVQIAPRRDRIVPLQTYTQFQFEVKLPEQKIKPGTYVGEAQLMIAPKQDVIQYLQAKKQILAGKNVPLPKQPLTKRMQLRVDFFDPLAFHKKWLPVLFGLTVLVLLFLFIWLTTPRFGEHQLRVLREGKPMYEVYLLAMHTHGLTGHNARGTPEIPRAIKFSMTGLTHFTRTRCILNVIRDDVDVLINDKPPHKKGYEMRHTDTITITQQTPDGEAKTFSYVYYDRIPNEDEIPAPKTIELDDDDIIIIDG